MIMNGSDTTIMAEKFSGEVNEEEVGLEIYRKFIETSTSIVISTDKKFNQINLIINQ